MTVSAAGAHPRGMATTEPEAKFAPTHELVISGRDSTMPLKAQADNTFLDEQGKRFTRGALDRMGSLRRVLPAG